MFDHTAIVVSDLKHARKFYGAIAGVPGFQTTDIGDRAVWLGRSAQEPRPILWIGTPRRSYWAEGCCAGLNQMQIAFLAIVKAFYRAALYAGGKDNGAPGRCEGAMEYSGASVLDLDGNNIEAWAR